jgi:hypothetical protein
MHVAREQRTAVFAKRAQLASLMLLGCVSLALAADKVAELSDDFLEYLGSMEGGDENWTDFATDGGKARDSAQHIATPKDSKTAGNTAMSASSSSAASVTTKAASTATGKAEK